MKIGLNREKNRLGQTGKLGQQGGNLAVWGPPDDFSRRLQLGLLRFKLKCARFIKKSIAVSKMGG